MKFRIKDKDVWTVLSPALKTKEEMASPCKLCCLADKNGQSQRDCPTVGAGMDSRGGLNLCLSFGEYGGYFVDARPEPDTIILKDSTRLVAILGIVIKRAEKRGDALTDETVLAFTSHQNDPNVTVGDVRLAMEELKLANTIGLESLIKQVSMKTVTDLKAIASDMGVDLIGAAKGLVTDVAVKKAIKTFKSPFKDFLKK